MTIYSHKMNSTLEKIFNLTEDRNPILSDQELNKCIFSQDRKVIPSAFKGCHHTDEVKRKIGNAARGRTMSKETRQKLREANLGKSPSKETRQKISQARTGMVFSDSHRHNISKGKKGKSTKPMTEETKRKIAETTRRNWAVKKSTVKQF